MQTFLEEAPYSEGGLYFPFDFDDNATAEEWEQYGFPSGQEILDVEIDDGSTSCREMNDSRQRMIKIPIEAKIILTEKDERETRNEEEYSWKRDSKTNTNYLAKKATCFICCQPRDNSDMLRGPCFHYCCKNCWESWLKEQPTCPYCRKPVMKKQLRHLWSYQPFCGKAYKYFVNLRRKELGALSEFLDPVTMESMIKKEWQTKNSKERSAIARFLIR